MSTFLYACGFDGFSKLTSLKLMNKDGVTKEQLDDEDVIKLINKDGVTKEQLDDEDVINLLHPFLLMQLTDIYHLHNIVITWSRTGLTFKRKDNSFFSVITQFSNEKSATFNQLHVLENQIVVAATDKDIILKNHELKTQYFVLKEKSSNIERIQIDCQLETATIKGTNQNYFLTFDKNFGYLTDESCQGKDVENVQEDHLKFYCISSGLVIEEISCGKEHVILLDDNGCIFSYGGGSKGQLGHNTVESKSLPTLIDVLHGLRIKSISAGGWHSAAVSDIGDLYMWGWNESGQLGLLSAQSLAHDDGNSSSKIVAEPLCVPFSSEVNVVSVSCGSRHTVLLTDSGEVFASGWNGYGQLGLGDTINRWFFSKLDRINNLTYKKVFAGQWNTFLFCEHACE